ncbi:MAG: (Fe-S)-binding protein [Eubacterium sp.]|nr:(Fe-S)-binding protein [Eubacterium sp.]
MLDIYEYLPHTECKRCGLEGCMAFAAALAAGEIKLSSCAPLRLDNQRLNRERIEKMMAEG